MTLAAALEHEPAHAETNQHNAKRREFPKRWITILTGTVLREVSSGAQRAAQQADANRCEADRLAHAVILPAHFQPRMTIQTGGKKGTQLNGTNGRRKESSTCAVARPAHSARS